jgi:hypothetical protein
MSRSALGRIGCGSETHRLEKVRQYRGMRTPIGIKIMKAIVARRAWSLTLFSYSVKGMAMVSAAYSGTRRRSPTLPGGRNEERQGQRARGRERGGKLRGTSIYISLMHNWCTCERLAHGLFTDTFGRVDSSHGTAHVL